MTARAAIKQSDLRRMAAIARGTFVTLAYRNGSSIKEIAEVTGHSEKDAETIIRKHYLVSSAAVERVESRTRSVNQAE